MDNKNPPPPTSGESLAASTAAGDERSLKTIQQCEQLLVKNRDRLYRFILKNTGNSSFARDLLQQTMLEAVKGYASFRGESAPSTWLFGIARNIIRNYIFRSPSRRFDFVNADVLTDTPSPGHAPDTTLEWKERIAHIESAISSLPEKLRQVLIMVALKENSYKSVGAQLGISVGTVRSRLSRARAQLRRRLESRALLPAAASEALKASGGLYAWIHQRPASAAQSPGLATPRRNG